MAATTFDRVAAKAADAPAFLKVLLTVLAFPFWLIGAVVAVVWVAIVFAWSALLVGFGDAKSRCKPRGDA
jgi:hypothetical protein